MSVPAYLKKEISNSPRGIDPKTLHRYVDFICRSLKDHTDRSRVLRKILFLHEDPVNRAESVFRAKWANIGRTLYKARVGKVRIIYDVDHQGRLELTGIGYRKDVYADTFGISVGEHG